MHAIQLALIYRAFLSGVVVNGAKPPSFGAERTVYLLIDTNRCEIPDSVQRCHACTI
jgi:hypothetical protein